eukprot:202290-Chlamydomonas_euryale.AAC.4
MSAAVERAPLTTGPCMMINLRDNGGDSGTSAGEFALHFPHDKLDVVAGRPTPCDMAGTAGADIYSGAMVRPVRAAAPWAAQGTPTPVSTGGRTAEGQPACGRCPVVPPPGIAAGVEAAATTAAVPGAAASGGPNGSRPVRPVGKQVSAAAGPPAACPQSSTSLARSRQATEALVREVEEAEARLRHVRRI